jgi:hypothetical protein
MKGGKQNTRNRDEPNEYRRITLELDFEIPVWHDTDCDGEPIASVVRPDDAQYPWRLIAESVTPEVMKIVEDEFTEELQDEAAKEAAERADERRDHRGMSEEEYMERRYEHD